MSAPVLVAHQISRYYGKFPALSETDLELCTGEVVVIGGPNGSGKTTLLLCLAGLLRPSSGRVEIEGLNVFQQERESRRKLAFVPDVPGFYTELTAWEHLRFIAMAHEVEDGFEERAQPLLEELDLWDARHLFPHNYSRGMQLKLGLALALIRPFSVLLLDEPTSALDINAAALVRRKLAALRRAGAAILLTTHDPLLAQDVGDRLWFIQQGRLEKR